MDLVDELRDDVNVLIALVDSAHLNHDAAQGAAHPAGRQAGDRQALEDAWRELAPIARRRLQR